MLQRRKGGRPKEDKENPRVFFCLCIGKGLEQAISLPPLCDSKVISHSDKVTSHTCGSFIQQQGQQRIKIKWSMTTKHIY